MYLYIHIDPYHLVEIHTFVYIYICVCVYIHIHRYIHIDPYHHYLVEIEEEVERAGLDGAVVVIHHL